MAGTGTRVAGWSIVAGIVLFLVGVALASLVLTPDNLSPVASLPQLRRVALLAGGGGIALLGLVLILVGLATYVLVPALGSGERARLDYGSHRVVLACTVLALLVGNVLAALYFIPAAVASYLGGAGIQRFASEALSPTGIAISAAAPDIALLGIVYLRIVRPGAISWVRMGLERELLGRRLLVGVLGALLLFGLSAAVELALESVGIRQTQAELFRSVRSGGLGGLALILLSGSVIAPVVEEIYFRGFVFRGYLDQKGMVRAFLYSAAIFAAVHMNAPALLPIFVMGLVLAYMFYRTGSIVPGIVAHGLNNAAAFLLVYLGLQ